MENFTKRKEQERLKINVEDTELLKIDIIAFT